MRSVSRHEVLNERRIFLFQEVSTAILKEKAEIGSEEDPKQAYESIAFVEQLQGQIM